MGDLCDVALDAPEEKEEKRRGERGEERREEREEKLMLMSMEGTTRISYMYLYKFSWSCTSELVQGSSTLLSSSAFPSVIIISHFTL